MLPKLWEESKVWGIRWTGIARVVQTNTTGTTASSSTEDPSSILLSRLMHFTALVQPQGSSILYKSTSIANPSARVAPYPSLLAT
jgi:hypothetical protein